MAALPLTAPLSLDDDDPRLSVSRPYTPIPLEWLPTDGGERWVHLRGRDDYAISSKARLARTLLSNASHPGFILKPEMKRRPSLGFTVPKWIIYEAGRKKHVYAHRAMYEAFHGPIPDGFTPAPVSGNDLSPENLMLVPHWGPGKRPPLLIISVTPEAASWVMENGGSDFAGRLITEAYEKAH